MISIYLTNLGKYNEGELVGEWVELPIKSKALEAALERIGIDNVRYEEYFLTDYESLVAGIIESLGEYSNLSTVNYLALRLKSMDVDELKCLEAVIDYEGETDIDRITNLTYNLDCYYYREDITTPRDYGEMLVDEGYLGEIPDSLANYLDHAAIGNEFLLDSEAGLTKYGLVERIDEMNEVYSGYKDMPSPEEIDQEIELLEENEFDR